MIFGIDIALVILHLGQTRLEFCEGELRRWHEPTVQPSSSLAIDDQAVEVPSDDSFTDNSVIAQ